MRILSCHIHLVCSQLLVYAMQWAQPQIACTKFDSRKNVAWVQNARDGKITWGRAARAVEWGRVPPDNQKSRKLIHEQFYWRWRLGVWCCVLADCLQREQCEIEQRSKLIRACMIDLSESESASLSLIHSCASSLGISTHSCFLWRAAPEWNKCTT